MIVALDAAASWMSSLVMPPTPRRTKRQLHLVALELLEALGDRLERTGDVGLDDEVERGGLAGLDLARRCPRGVRRRRRRRRCRRSRPPAASARGSRPRCGPTSRRGRRRSRRRPRRRRTRPSTCTGVDGPASLICSPLSSMSARTRPQAAPATSGSPTLRSAALHEDRGHGAAADVEVGLEDHAPGPPVGLGLELLDLGDDEEVLEQVVDAGALERRDLDHDRVAAPRLGDEAPLGQLGHDPLRVGVLAVDLVDGHDDRHVGRLGVVERLDASGASRRRRPRPRGRRCRWRRRHGPAWR